MISNRIARTIGSAYRAATDYEKYVFVENLEQNIILCLLI